MSLNYFELFKDNSKSQKNKMIAIIFQKQFELSKITLKMSIYDVLMICTTQFIYQMRIKILLRNYPLILSQMSHIYNNKIMGFKYLVEVKESVYEGLGVFASVFIPKGEIISTFVREENDIATEGRQDEGLTIYTKQQLFQLQRTNKDNLSWILHYGYYHQGSDSFIVDYSPRNLNNHSNDPNYEHVVDQLAHKQYYRAIKDIYPGDELLQKYWGISQYSKIEWLFDLFCKYEQSRVKTMALVCD